MRAVTFSIRESVTPARRRTLLKEISAWPGITAGGFVDSTSKNKHVVRMGYAYIEEGTIAVDIVNRLKQVPEIESASVPPERRLP